MSKLVIVAPDFRKVLECALKSDPAAFYVGEDRRAVTGARLSARAGDGEVTVTSNRLSEGQLSELFAAFLPAGAEAPQSGK